MSLNVVFDCSGSMSEKKSQIFHLFYIITNIRKEYKVDVELYIWNENLLSFKEPKDLVFTSNLNTKLLLNLVESDDSKILLVTDGCFSISIREELKDLSLQNNLEYLLIGEDCNIQIIKRITKNEIFKSEDLITCLNRLCQGVFQ